MVVVVLVKVVRAVVVLTDVANVMRMVGATVTWCAQLSSH